MPESRERGRPPLPEKDRKDATLRVRLRVEDLERLQEVARAADVKPSTWARDALLRALEARE